MLAEGIEKRLGGSAAVASFTIKKLGIDSSFIGMLGDDDVSKYLKGELSDFKIKHKDIITIKGAKSSQSYVYEDNHGERLLAAFNEKKILNNEDIFGRGFKLKKINIDNTYPEYIIKNKEKYLDWII